MMFFHQTAETGGDCTAPYEITFTKPYTVREFIEAIFHDRKNEYGVIDLKVRGNTKFIYRYEYGKLEKDIEDEKLLDTIILKATAAGGWGLMNYDIQLKISDTPSFLGKFLHPKK